MHLRRIVLHLVVCCGAVLLGGRAVAQDTEGAFQLALVTDLLSYSSATIEFDETGVEVETTVLNWGVRDNVALELGYGITDMLVLGAFVRLGGETVTVAPQLGGDTENSDVGVLIGPKLDVVFGTSRSEVRPFAGFAVALESTTVNDEDMGLETSLLGLNLQGRVGLHWFVMPAISVDPVFAFAWGTANGEVDEIQGDDSLEVSGTGINVSAMLGLSAWID
jgi:hypothetical protein